MRRTQDTVPDIHFNEIVRQVPTGPENIPTMPLIVDLSIPANIPERMFPRKYQEVAINRPPLGTPKVEDFRVTKISPPRDVVQRQALRVDPWMMPTLPNKVSPVLVAPPCPTPPGPLPERSQRILPTPIQYDNRPSRLIAYLMGVLCGMAIVLGTLTLATEQGYLAPLSHARPTLATE